MKRGEVETDKAWELAWRENWVIFTFSQVSAGWAGQGTRLMAVEPECDS